MGAIRCCNGSKKRPDVLLILPFTCPRFYTFRLHFKKFLGLYKLLHWASEFSWHRHAPLYFEIQPVSTKGMRQITFLHLLAMHVTFECSQSVRETEIFRLIISKTGIFDLNRGMCLLTKPLIRNHLCLIVLS